MGTIIKAILGGAGAFIASLVTALGDNVISGQEWVTAAGAAIIALGVVYQIPNSKPSS